MSYLPETGAAFFVLGIYLIGFPFAAGISSLAFAIIAWAVHHSLPSQQ